MVEHRACMLCEHWSGLPWGRNGYRAGRCSSTDAETLANEVCGAFILLTPRTWLEHFAKPEEPADGA